MSRFDVVIREESRIARKHSPVTIGLPFRQAAVTDLSRVGVWVGTDPVLAQLSEVCRWKDGSLRWAHARVLLDLEADEEVRLTVDVNGAQPQGGRPLAKHAAKD